MDRKPFLRSDGVGLYPLEKEDLPRLQHIVNQELVWHWISINTPQNMDDEEEFFESIQDDDNHINFLIYDEAADLGVGNIGLRITDRDTGVADIGIMIDPDCHTQGHGTRALKLAIKYGFEELNLHKVWARALDHNEKSIGLFEKLGFTEEGRLREHAFTGGEYHDFVVYGLLAEEYGADS